MAADVAGVGLSDIHSSAPWLWPFGRKAIVYRWDCDGRTTSYVALVPNLAAWAISLIGLIGGLAALVSARHPTQHSDGNSLILTLLALWAVFMLSDLVLARYA